jgi:hypothetical protein
VIKPEDVEQYVQYDQDIRSLQEKQDKLRKRLIAEFQKGAVCPPGQYQLLYTEQPRRGIRWKAVAMTLARRLKGRRLLKRLLKEQPERTVPTIDIYQTGEKGDGEEKGSDV